MIKHVTGLRFDFVLVLMVNSNSLANHKIGHNGLCFGFTASRIKTEQTSNLH